MSTTKSFLTVILMLFLASCAKQSTPTGGPRDKTAPVLLESSPLNKSLNTKPKEILLTFDEYVRLENPSKGIVITPRIKKDEVEFTALKNTVLAKLNQELEDSTTYVFDFQKSVVDISEGNPAENLKLVFSTGSILDSLEIEGSVRFVFPPTTPDFTNVLVGIYPEDDTTDVFTAQPYYLSQVDSLGNFSLTNIKNGSYRAYAWKDTNGSLKAESKSEEYDFLPETLIIDQNVNGINFNLSKGDMTPIRILRSASFGSNYDVILNKEPIESSIKQEKLGTEYFYAQTGPRLRIYSKMAQTDSVQFQLSIQDSVGFKKDSLIWAKFPQSERKPEKLELSANSGKSFVNELNIELKFTKPVLSISTDSLFIAYDTAGRIPVNYNMLHFADSSKRDLLHIKLTIPDSLTQEIFSLQAADSTFQDVEKQYNEKKLVANYKKLDKKMLADEVSGTILGASPPFIVQLMSDRGELIHEVFLENTSFYSFKQLEPGNFSIRAIEDRNGNKRWDPANYNQKRLAERVFFFVDDEQKPIINIRSGWTLEEQNIQATPATGKSNYD